jgi:hypothetical protein
MHSLADEVRVGPALADYIVPAALRAMGVLVYSEPLANVVDTWQLIPRESI